MPKSSLDRSSWGSTSSLAIGAFNVWQVTVTLDWTSIGPRPRRHISRLGMKGYWKREKFFCISQPDLDQEGVLGRPVY